MDIPQLKLLASRIRDLLQQQYNQPVGHNQSLDLAAALPGLRNWPEVLAFPERVAASELDASSSSRLAFRLKKKFGIEVAPQVVLAALASDAPKSSSEAPLVWPAGPVPGVYLTNSQKAIDALLEVYEEATDGALMYAERAGNAREGSIDLGEYGLWSSGLNRVPSGTLLVVGPLEFDQQSWNDSAERLEMACLLALNSGLRVAVLIDTPAPEAMHEDALLMVESGDLEGDAYVALRGGVSEGGELQSRTPFARSRPLPVEKRSTASPDAIPAKAMPLVQRALAERSTGLLLFGSSVLKDHAAIDLVAAALSLTESAGPAARIMPRHRGTPAKDWMVPDAIKELPFLPSIESAYDQGYRRLIYSPTYTKAEVLLEYASDTLLISGTYGSEVTDVFMSTLRASGIDKETELLANVIAILGVMPLKTKRGQVSVCDCFIAKDRTPIQARRFEEVFEYLESNRVLNWQDEVNDLLDSRLITAAAIAKEMPRDYKLKEFLDKRRLLRSGARPKVAKNSAATS